MTYLASSLKLEFLSKVLTMSGYWSVPFTATSGLGQSTINSTEVKYTNTPKAIIFISKNFVYEVVLQSKYNYYLCT